MLDTENMHMMVGGNEGGMCKHMDIADFAKGCAKKPRNKEINNVPHTGIVFEGYIIQGLQGRW